MILISRFQAVTFETQVVTFRSFLNVKNGRLKICQQQRGFFFAVRRSYSGTVVIQRLYNAYFHQCSRVFYTESYITSLFDFSYILVQQLLQVSSMFIDFFFLCLKIPLSCDFRNWSRTFSRNQIWYICQKGCKCRTLGAIQCCVVTWEGEVHKS